MVYLTLDDKIPLWGLEGVCRNGTAVGYLRRAEFGYYINKSIGKSYIRSNDGHPIDLDELAKGRYEIDVLGKLHRAKIHLHSPLDFSNWYNFPEVNMLPVKYLNHEENVCLSIKNPIFKWISVWFDITIKYFNSNLCIFDFVSRNKKLFSLNVFCPVYFFFSSVLNVQSFYLKSLWKTK